MKNILLILLIAVTGNLFSQTYTIPGATEQPAWVFPLWFEDALGNKDTLYFGYDPDAVDYGLPDTIFGEKNIPVDTSQFNVVWDGGVSYTDTGTYGRKVRILKLEAAFGDGIGFYSTWYPPVILRWDKNLFYSDVLPFPDNGDAPRAWGVIETSGDMTPDGCSFQYPFFMTDTTFGVLPACYKEDSMVFTNGSLSVQFFLLQPWQPYWGTDIKNISENTISIYPNPISSDVCTLKTPDNDQLLLKIYSNNGYLVYKTQLAGSTTYTLHLPEISSGVYFINIIQNNYFQSLKLIKL